MFNTVQGNAQSDSNPQLHHFFHSPVVTWCDTFRSGFSNLMDPIASAGAGIMTFSKNAIGQNATAASTALTNATSHVGDGVGQAVQQAENRVQLNSPQNTLLGVLGSMADNGVVTFGRIFTPSKAHGSPSPPSPLPSPPKKWKRIAKKRAVNSTCYGTIEKMISQHKSTYISNLKTAGQSIAILCYNFIRHVGIIATKSIKAPLYMVLGALAGLGWTLLAMSAEERKDGTVSSDPTMDKLGKFALLFISGLVLAYEATVTSIMTPFLLFVGFRFGMDLGLDPLDHKTKKLDAGIYKNYLLSAGSVGCHYLAPPRCYKILIDAYTEELKDIGKTTKTPELMDRFIQNIENLEEESNQLIRLVELRGKYEAAVDKYRKIQDALSQNEGSVDWDKWALGADLRDPDLFVKYQQVEY